MFSPEQIDMLEASLSRAHVSTRKQSGRNLSYIEGWFAIKEANRIFGFDQWCRETIDIRLLSEKPRKIGRDEWVKDGFGVSYFAKVRVTVGNIVREGCGTGHGIDVDVGLAHESALKEAETDAMKRALMTFGNPFGLALYDKTQSDVSDDRDDTTPTPVPTKNAAETRAYYTKMESMIRKAPNVDELESLYRVNRNEIKADKFKDDIMKEFSSRRTELEAQ
jgi:DNA repair and recombination protein RAD52